MAKTSKETASEDLRRKVDDMSRAIQEIRTLLLQQQTRSDRDPPVANAATPPQPPQQHSSPRRGVGLRPGPVNTQDVTL
jgi:hypothetical protein